MEGNLGSATRFAFLLVGVFIVAVASEQNELPGEIRLELVDEAAGYHGLVKENETRVEITPRIIAVGAPVCRFEVTDRHHADVPFEVVVVDQKTGEGEMRAKQPPNCETKKSYKFEITAWGCSGEVSKSVTARIKVQDVNEHAPEFGQPSYVVEAEEGRLYPELLTVTATDSDCSPKFGDVCKYEILNDDAPFIINSEGILKNTEPLNYERSHNHILSVVAYDCGMRRSEPVMVNIKVNRVCHIGWKGVSDEVSYRSGEGAKALFPNADLSLCQVPCEVEKMETKISLSTGHIGKGCDRDTYSVENQRRICGADEEASDLLPPPKTGKEWTVNLPTDDGNDADQVFAFNGIDNSAILPDEVLSHNFSSDFTISFWMKHKPSPDFDSHHKEHILCSSDDHKMNRHHVALFVRNCRLILLLRKEFNEADLNTFKPAEWRWKIGEVCDDSWHHIAVSMKFPDAKLFLDGQEFVGDEKNPQVIDDWPLHPTQDIQTKMTVGACWQGSENHMKHYFRGFLAGLSVLLHRQEKPEVIRCLQQCQESLTPPPIALFEPGMEVQTTRDMNQVTVMGPNVTNLVNLVRRVSYNNTRELPTPGRRPLTLTSKIMCRDGKRVSVPSVESFVNVARFVAPTLDINGSGNAAYNYDRFRAGINLFPALRISVSTDPEEQEMWKNGEPLSVIRHKLDSCKVSVHPPLNPDHETIELPENLLAASNIHGKVTKEGVSLEGPDAVYTYEQVLRQAHYVNRKPAYYLNRLFKLVCSEMNGRFHSNEFVQILTVIHPKAPEPQPAPQPSNSIHEDNAVESAADNDDEPAGIPHTVIEPKVSHVRVNSHSAEFPGPQIHRSSAKTTLAAGGASHAVTIIVVVCIGFLVFMVALGVVRIRAAHKRGQHEAIADQEMAWDDSALTITVNPMDMERPERTPLNGESDDDSSDNDDSSYSHDEEEDDAYSGEEDEVEIETTKTKELEWDNNI